MKFLVVFKPCREFIWVAVNTFVNNNKFINTSVFTIDNNTNNLTVSIKYYIIQSKFAIRELIQLQGCLRAWLSLVIIAEDNGLESKWCQAIIRTNPDQPSAGDQRIYKLLYFINTLRLRQNGRHFKDDTFKCIFLNEYVRISIKISLKFVPKVRINNIPALVQKEAWHRPGNKSLSEPMMVKLLTHMCHSASMS